MSNKTEFEQDMHYQLQEKDKIKNVLNKFETEWFKKVDKYKRKLRDSYFSIKRPNLIMSTIWETHWK